MAPDNPDHSLRILGWSLHALGLLLVLAVSVAGRLALVTPLEKRRSECALQLLEINRLAREATQIQADYVQAKEALEQARRQAEIAQQRVPTERGEMQFLADIAALADSAGVTILDVHPGVVSTNARSSEMPFRLSAEGKYQNLCGLLDQVSQLPRLVAISDLAVTSSARSDRYAIDLTLVVYFKLRGDVAMRGRRTGRG